MPVLKHEVDPAPRWLWRRATLARKASGRYFDAEDEKIRALVSRLSKGISPEGNIPAELQACQAYLDKYRPGPGWHPHPPHVTGSGNGLPGLPIWEVIFHEHQPAQMDGFVRLSGVRKHPGLDASRREAAFLPRVDGATAGAGKLWLRAQGRAPFYGPIKMSVGVNGDEDEPWMAAPCWIRCVSISSVMRASNM